MLWPRNVKATNNNFPFEVSPRAPNLGSEARGWNCSPSGINRRSVKNFLGLGTGDTMFLNALGFIAGIPLEREFVEGQQPVPEPLNEPELGHNI